MSRYDLSLGIKFKGSMLILKMMLDHLLAFYKIIMRFYE
jgi:hypothetical protein